MSLRIHSPPNPSPASEIPFVFEISANQLATTPCNGLYATEWNVQVLIPSTDYRGDFVAPVSKSPSHSMNFLPLFSPPLVRIMHHAA
jgi:hypothetical protein